MTWEFMFLFTASCAISAFFASALVGLLMPVLDRSVGRTEAVGRARLWLFIAGIPVLATLIVMVAAFGSAIGLATDHCGVHPNTHAHLCYLHPTLSFSPWLALPAAALVARLGTRILRAGWNLLRVRRLVRALTHDPDGSLDCAHVIEAGQPQAFVLGFFRPKVFISRALLEGGCCNLQVVLNHERAHADRRDPLRRLAASLMLAFHLPGIADKIERRLGLAHEMAADAVAARLSGDRVGVAESLLAITRLQQDSIRPAAFAFDGDDVSARVRELLREVPRPHGPRRGALVLALGVLLTFVIVQADPVHHWLEHALEIFGG